LGKKFGCDPVAEGPHLIKAARALNLDVVGISFHVGSGCADYPIYYKAIGMAKDLFDYAETIGYEFNLLDIGGGFPGDKGKTIDDVALYVNQGLDCYFPDKSVKVIAEPGRYYVASAFTLVCNVQSKRVCLNAKTGAIDRIMYYVNDGVYGSFNSILYDHQHQQPKLLDQPSDTSKEYDSTIWGPTCDALDQIIETIRLPEINIDDWVIFENMGAYTIPVASPFNGFPLPTIQCYVNEEAWEMLKNLIPEDIFTVHSAENGLNSMVYENVVCA
jgi:ornithine decarboxylase